MQNLHHMQMLECRRLIPKGHRMDDPTPLFLPQLGPAHHALFPWAEALLRAVVGLTLIPHGLRTAFGMFPSTGGQSHNLAEPYYRKCAKLRQRPESLGLEIDTAEVNRAEDISPAFDAFKTRVQAIYVCSDALMNANGVRINTLALGAHLPTMFGTRSFIDGGGLMAYGANNADLFRHAGDYVDKILRGAKPGDIPVEQPIKFDLVINLTTAKAIGLTIPTSFLQRADEVIE
jgi:hypothetical protein